MSSLHALRSAPARLQKLARSPRPRLRRIDSPVRRLPGFGFGLLVVAIVVAGMVGLLVLNTALQDQEFEVRRAQRQANELAYRVSDLETKVHRAASPAEIAGRATELGMVPNPTGAFIDLGSGRIIGEPKAATGQELPSLRVARPATPLDPHQIQKVTTNVLPWFDLDGLQAPIPSAPPAESLAGTVARAGAPR